MSRFLSRKGSKDATLTNESPQSEMSTPKQPRTLQNKLWRRKKEAPSQETELDLIPELPPVDKFRNSLMPDLSARFSMLKGSYDMSTTRSDANDDLMFTPMNKSLLGDLPDLGPRLFDIAETPSPRPSQEVFHSGSYTHSQNLIDSPPIGSIMDRGRPVEGNAMFGNRQRSYKLQPNTPSPFRSQTVSAKDVNTSALQFLREKEREVEREWRRAKQSRKKDMGDNSLEDLDLSSRSPKKGRWGTGSSMESGFSCKSSATAATSLTGQSPQPRSASPIETLSNSSNSPRYAFRSPPTSTSNDLLVRSAREQGESASETVIIDGSAQETVYTPAQELRSVQHDSGDASFAGEENLSDELHLQRQQSLSEAQALSQQERRKQRAQCVRTLTNATRNGRRAGANIPVLETTSAPTQDTVKLHPALRPAASFDKPLHNSKFAGLHISTTHSGIDNNLLTPSRAGADLGGLIRGHLRHPSDQSSVYPNSPRPFCASTSEFNLLSPTHLSPTLSPSDRFSSLDLSESSPTAHLASAGLGIAQTVGETRLPAVPEIVRESCESERSWNQTVPRRARAGTTETQYEREAFSAELAQRQKAIQESLRTKMANNNRTPSPNVGSWGGFERPFGLLRGKSSRDTIASKHESHKPRTMLGLSTKTSASSFMSTAKASSSADTRRFGLDGATSPIGQTLQSKLRGLQTEEDTPPSSPDIIDDYLTDEQDIRRSVSERSTTSNHANSHQEPTYPQAPSHKQNHQQRLLDPLVTSFPTTPQQDTFDPSLQLQSPADSVPTLSSTTSPSLNSVYASPPQTLEPPATKAISSTSAAAAAAEARHVHHRKLHVQKGDISDPVLIAKTYAFDTVDLPEGASLRNGADGGVDVVLAAGRGFQQHRRPTSNVTSRLATVRLVGPPSGNVVEME